MKQQSNIKVIFNYLTNTKNLEDVSLDYLKAEIIKLEKEGKVDNKNFNVAYSFYVAKKEDLETISRRLQ